jgi:hypothetical protein
MYCLIIFDKVLIMGVVKYEQSRAGAIYLISSVLKTEINWKVVLLKPSLVR